MKDHWKRGILPFKMLFHLYLYNFRFLRYHDAKKIMIFNHLFALTYLYLF